MISKDCFLVTAYCNIEKKKKALVKTLTELKKYNKEIILYSHYPLTEPENQLSHYAIYDYSNPIIDINQGSMLHWIIIDQHRLCTLYPDYGYAAIQQWKRGLLLANLLEFENVYVLNYDLEINKELIGLTEEGLKTHNSVLLDYDFISKDPAMHMSWAGIKPKYFLEEINQINPSDYLSTFHNSIPESYLYTKFYSSNTLKIDKEIWETIATTTISMGEDSFVDEFYTKEGFKWILGQEKVYNQGVETLTNKTILCLWGINTEISIEVFINDKKVSLKDIKSTPNTTQIYLPIPYDQLRNYLNNNLKIVINGVEIETELLKLSTIAAIEDRTNE
jgi:hypothetical protein